MSVAFSRVITLQAVDLIMRYAASALFSLTAWAVTAASPSSAVFRRDPWTMHDPGFPVKIDVAPSQDEVWAAEHVTSDAESDVLHVSSSVLDVSVAFPDNFSTDEAMVTMSLFEPSSSTTSDAEFEMFIDSQLQYVRQYRVELDPKKAGDRFVLRVYVEASAAHRNGTKVEESGAKLRAFYARWIDLSPSEPRFISCETQESSSSADDAEENEEERVATRPPANMPMDMCSRFTMNGRVPVRKWYFDDQTGAERPEEYSQETITKFVEDARKHTIGYSAADTFLYTALKNYPLKDKHVLVVGSSGLPWIESLCIAHEAASCTTVARNRLRYNHPKLQTFTNAEFKDKATADSSRQYDAVIAAEAIASEGLGRAGDPLDPDGDLILMQGLRKFAAPPCKPDSEDRNTATVFLSVPVGPDTLVWNAQRQYGSLRLPLLLQGWQVLDSYGFTQSDFSASFSVSHLPLFVLQSPASCSHESDGTASDEHTEL